MSSFGRKWQIDIVTGADDTGEATVVTVSSDVDGEPLRIEFDVSQFGYQAWWYGEIILWNLDISTATLLLQEGMRVTLSAGYNDGNYGQIFSGKIMQAFIEREDVTDFRMILHCVNGRPEITKNLVNRTLDGPLKQEDLAQFVALNAPTQLSLKYLANVLSKKQLPRGRTLFIDPVDFFDDIAADNRIVWFYDSDGNVNLTDYTHPDPDTIVYSPETGIIGTPIQTQQGVNFKVLLDPRFKIKLNPVQVQLQNTALVYQKQLIGQLPSILDQSGIYVIGAVRHFGDSRGTPWYTECTGYTTVAGKLGLLGATASLATLSDQQGIDQKQ